jgi:hypothetical protein
MKTRRKPKWAGALPSAHDSTHRQRRTRTRRLRGAPRRRGGVDRDRAGDLRRQRPHPLGRRPVRVVRVPAIAPALFDRGERGVELGYDDAGRKRGIELVMPIAFDAAMLDVAAAVDHVERHRAGRRDRLLLRRQRRLDRGLRPPDRRRGRLLRRPGVRDDRPHSRRCRRCSTSASSTTASRSIRCRRSRRRIPTCRCTCTRAPTTGSTATPASQYDARSAAIALGRTLEFLADNGVTP